MKLIRQYKITLIILLLIGTANLTSAQKWTANWEQLRSRPYPQWFKDAKLGIFIHWGISSVPAYGGRESYAEWYLRGLQVGDSLRTNFMKKNFGENFTYRDFAPLFKAELFDPDEWADLFKRAGAKYVIFVTKHHDGYCLWPSKYAPNWNSMDVGPHRDLVGELTRAVRRAGLKMGFYYSLPEWNHPLHRWYTDPHDSITAYVEQHMIPQFKELVSAYKPSLLFADGEWFNSAEQWHAAELISWYFNLVGDEAIVNDRWGGGSNIGFRTPEYSAGIRKSDRPWSEVRGLGRSFGLNRNEKLEAYMQPQDLIHFFIRAVSNGGGITINVGPKADGQIPLLQQERLVQLGEWLQINGEAIYSSDTWDRPGEFKEYTLRRTDPNIDFFWVRNTPGKPIREDHFNVQWTGFISVPYSEEYTFTGKADDGMRLWIDHKLIIDQWDDQKAGTDSQAMESDRSVVRDGKIFLEAGRRYPVKIDYFENTREAGIRLFWESRSQNRQIIPSAAFYVSDDPSADHGLSGLYRSEGQYIGYTVNQGNLYALCLEWPEDYLELPIPEPAKTVRITLLGRAGQLPWSYKDGRLRIETKKIKFSEMPGCYAWTFKLDGYAR